MNNYYVYTHHKPCGEIFYVGMGKGKRAWSVCDRNNLWRKIVLKYGNHTVKIIKQNLSHSDAIELEKNLISKYGRIDISTGTLSNLTNGGDGGVVGLKQSKETIEKRVKHIRGISCSEEKKRKIAEPQIGGRNHYAKKVIHIKSGKVFDCIKDAAIYININYNTLRRQLSNPISNPIFKYI